MGEFNLLTEPWISVITDDRGKTEEVSLIDVFKNADKYISLAGDMKAQDFAVMRVLLAVLHTVFSRFDADGNPYDYLKLDEKFMQNSEVNEDDEEDYLDDLTNTWIKIWKEGKFPDIIENYLMTWKDRFYLYDDKYPFFQVTAKDFEGEKYSSKGSPVQGKNINRLISESGNKISLFSPKKDIKDNKNVLSDSEAAKWILTFQQYTGLSDKARFTEDKYKASKGWLFDLGGVYMEGNNLFETLWLNCILVHPKEEYRLTVERPCWEHSPEENIETYFEKPVIDNISELYTNWSRAIYIEPKEKNSEAFAIKIVKLPDTIHEDNFLEPMTIWRFNESGDNKGKYTPRKHRINQSLWRSFGLIAFSDSGPNVEIPGIIKWFDKVVKIIGDRKVGISIISMEDDGNATSWVPTDEIYDSLYVGDFILTDNDKEGWTIRVNEVIDLTKKIVEKNFRYFVSQVKEIRNLKSKSGFESQKVEELYFKIDKPFRDWIGSIKDEDDKDEKIRECKTILKKLTFEAADEIIGVGDNRDLFGIEKDGKTLNISTADNSFRYFIRKELE